MLSEVVQYQVAVVFDFVEKLRELDFAGDKEATKKLESFERIRQDNDFRRALEFERNVLEWSTGEFEFLSHQEYADLRRLLIISEVAPVYVRNCRSPSAFPSERQADLTATNDEQALYRGLTLYACRC